MIKLEKTTSNSPSYHVYYNTKYLGDAILDIDGFYYFYFANDKNTGCWSSYALRMIADKLDELNKEWNNYIDENNK